MYRYSDNCPVGERKHFMNDVFLKEGVESKIVGSQTERKMCSIEEGGACEGESSLFGINKNILSRAAITLKVSWFSLSFCTLPFGVVFQFACTIRLNCLAHLLTSMKQNAIVFPFVA